MADANKTDSQFPVLVSEVGNPMVYIFTGMDGLRKTYWDFYAQGAYNNGLFVDSMGRMFKAINPRFVKFGKFGGYNLHFNKAYRTIWIDFDWQPMYESASLADLKTKLKAMVAQNKEFWRESFGDMQELAKQVDKTKTYEELFMLFH